MSTEELQQAASLDEDLAGAVEAGIEAPEDAPPEPAQEVVEEIQYFDAPQYMPKNIRDAFNAWAERNEDGSPRYSNGHVWQSELKNWFEDNNRQFTQTTQKLSDYEKQLGQFHSFANEWNNALTPYNPLAARMGTDSTGLVRNALGLLQRLHDDPQATIERIARESGVDLNQIGAQQPYVSETEAKLSREFNALKREMAQRDQQQSQQRTQQLQAQQHAVAQQKTQQLHSFVAEEKDGQLAHPYLQPDNPFFQQVQMEMASLIHGYRAAGRGELDLDTAYDRACKSIPEIAQAESDRKAKEAAAKKAADAKKGSAASRRVTGARSGKQPPQQSLDDELWAKVNAA